MTLNDKLLAANLPVFGEAIVGTTVCFTRPLSSEETIVYENIVNPIWKRSGNVDDDWSLLKSYRNELLSRSDWTQLPDAVLTLEEKTAWQDYRQALRDIPQNYATPDDVIFPTPPNEVS